ncbi:MAG TPA: hypothetical protein DCQ13_05365 [Firmicutes bacterium]|jgi:hypothetical protein|nr:hypothetical protein [Bacillota bacterium]
MLVHLAVNPVGIDFYFAPYEVGSYADGTFHVRVTWSELKVTAYLHSKLGANHVII